MDETSVELFVCVDIPERIQPVAVVDMRVASHHLAVDAFDVALEGLREPGGFSEPLAA